MIGVGSLILTAYLLNGGSALPTVTSLGVTQGDTLGGELVPINGTNFTGATGVTIGGSICPSFSVISATLIYATAPAHAAATGQSVVVTTPAGTNVANTLYEFWAPSELALTGFWERGDYLPGTWTARASAGLSAGRSLTQATAANQPRETNLEPIFDGIAGFLATSLVLSDIVSAGGGTIAAIFEVSNPLSAPSLGYDEPTVFASSGADVVLSVNTSGVTATIYDGAFKRVTSAALIGQLHLVIMRWDGVTLGLSVDGATEVTIACGNAQGPGDFIQMGKNFTGSKFFPGTLREIGTMASRVSDANAIKILKWAQARHGVST